MIHPRSRPFENDERPLDWHRRQQIWMLAVTLLLTDAMLFAANIVHLASNDSHEPTSMFSGWMWNGDYDRSHIEMFAHVQIIGGAVMLAFLALSRRSLVYAAWSFGLTALFIDDFFRIHEDMGGFLVVYGYVEPMAGLRAQDVGELVILGIGAAVVGTLLVVTFFRASGIDRRNSLVLAAWLGVLAFFAVGVDQLSVILAPHVPHAVTVGLVLTETAGELVGMTLIVLAIHRMTLHQRAPDTAGAQAGTQPARASAALE
ncbi:MAG: hypothetical protein ACK4MD_02545 [Demequina sp.]